MRIILQSKLLKFTKKHADQRVALQPGEILFRRQNGKKVLTC